MIYLYTGTPGSGKSYHTAQQIIYKTRKKKENKVIANFTVVIKNQENFTYIDTLDMTPEFFYRFAEENHVQHKEGQTLVIIDEAQLIFNSRDWNSKNGNRMEWIRFFSQHRKYGYTIILTCQFDRMIDRQIRSLVEYEVAHMKIGNYFKFLPFTAFMCITRWYGQKMKIMHEVIVYRKKVASIYNTYAIFERAGDQGAPDERENRVVLTNT